MADRSPSACDRVTRSSPGSPQVFIDALNGNDQAPEGVHRVVYLDTANGRRTTCFLTVGDDPGGQVRTYVFFPYMEAKDLRSEQVRSDPWDALRGVGSWD